MCWLDNIGGSFNVIVCNEYIRINFDIVIVGDFERSASTYLLLVFEFIHMKLNAPPAPPPQ